MSICGTHRVLGCAIGEGREAGGRYGKMDASVERQLDPARRSSESRDFEAGLRRKIVGQDEAVQAVVDLYQVFRAGLNLIEPRGPRRGNLGKRDAATRRLRPLKTLQQVMTDTIQRRQLQPFVLLLL